MSQNTDGIDIVEVKKKLNNEMLTGGRKKSSLF